MRYDPYKHHRRSIRLSNYDYSQVGAYFVTICANGRVCLFGDVNDREMRLNDAGQMVERWCGEIPNKFPLVKFDKYVIMPNHFHVIVDILDEAPHGGHTGPPLPRIVQWFKTMTTNDYIRGVKRRGWTPFEQRLWQRDYYERVIRDEEELNTVRQYIINNPAKWAEDIDNPLNIAR